jgi:hypothetical protein
MDSHNLTEADRAALGRIARIRGLDGLARALSVPRSTLAGVIIGTAREATDALVALRLAERPDILPKRDGGGR